MAILTFNDDSLKRGGVTRAEALEVLDDPMTMHSEEGESRLGNPTVMYVGQTQKERLLEIGVEYKEKETHIYHGRKANAHNKAKYIKHSGTLRE